MSGFYAEKGIQTTEPGNTVFLKQAAIVCFFAAAAAAALAVILFFVFDIKKILQIKTGKARKRLIREMEKRNRGSKSGSGKNALLLIVAVLSLQLVTAGAAIPKDRTKAPVLIADEGAADRDVTKKEAADQEPEGREGTDKDIINKEAADQAAENGRTTVGEAADQSAENGRTTVGEAADQAAENGRTTVGEAADQSAEYGRTTVGEAADQSAEYGRTTVGEAVDRGTAGREGPDKDAANKKAADQEAADKEASAGREAVDDKATDKAEEKALDRAADRSADRSGDKAAEKAVDKAENKDTDNAKKKAAEKAVDKAPGKSADQTGSGKEVTDRDAVNCDAAKGSGNEKRSPQSRETAPPFLTMIEVRDRGNARVRKFPVTGQSGEGIMEGAARDYEVILYAGDDPEEEFSGLKFAEFRLEPVDGGGKTLEAVVPFGENSVSPEQAGEERSVISTPRTLVSGETPLFPSLQKDGPYILRTAVIDYEGNRSSECGIRLEIDSTPPTVHVSLPERGKTASWPAYRRSDNCAVDVMIREKNLRSYSIRIGTSLVITQDNVDQKWISKDNQAGTTVLSIPATEVVKNRDGKIEVSVSALDEASLETEELEEIGRDLLEVRDQNGKLTAAAFFLDTVPPVIQVEHRAAAGLHGENEETGETGGAGESGGGESDGSGTEPGEPGAGISDGMEAFLYGDSEEGRDLTLYSRNQVATEVTITDQSGGEEIVPDPELINASVYWKLSGEDSYSKHRLEKKTGDAADGKKWQAEFICGKKEEGSFYFCVKAADRAGNEAESGSGRQDGGETGQELAFFRTCKESLAPKGVLDCRKGSAGSAYPALDQELQSAFTIVIDRTPPELYLGYESSAVSYLYKGSRAGAPGGEAAGDFPPVDAYVNKSLTAIGEIRSEEHADPDRIFFVVRKSAGGETEDIVRRVPFGGGTRQARFETDGDGRYICALYGTDKAGNAAAVCEQLGSAFVKKEETVEIESLMTDGCGNGYNPYFAFYVDTRSPEALFLYSAGSGQLYLYEETRAAGIPRIGDAAGPSVTAVGKGKIAPSVIFRDQNVLDDRELELLEFRGERPRDMSCREIGLIHAGGDSDGNELRAAPLPDLDGNRVCAFYAVRGTDRAGNSLQITEQFDKGTKVSPEKADAAAGQAEEGGWQVTAYLLEVDQVSPRVSLTFEAGKNENRIYLYREKRKKGVPEVSAYFNGTIRPSISVTENGIIDPDRLEIFEHVSGEDPSDGSADKGRKLEFDCAEDPEGREEQDVREVGNLTVLEADGTTAFYTVRGTDRAGNPVVIERDEIRDPKKVSGQGADAGTIMPQASPAEREVDPADPVYRSHLLFVIDRTCPEIALTYRSGTRAYIYADRGEKWTREKEDERQTGQRKEEHFFAFSADTAVIKAKITNRNEHIDSARLICSCTDGTGKTTEKSGWEAADGELIMKAAGEGEYEYRVRGTDKAGNAAAVTENYTGRCSDRTGRKVSDPNGWKKRTEGCAEDFSPRFTIIIDKTAPRITLEYRNTFSSRQKGSSGNNPRAYIYADRGEVLGRDGNVTGGLTVYVSGRTDVTLSLEEKYPDPGRLFCSRYCSVPDPSSGKSSGTEKKASWKGKGMSFSPPAATRDGEYRYGAFGTDRAGNPAVVTERFAAGTRLERRLVPGGGGSFRTSIRQTRQEKEYRSLFTIIIDTTAPEYRFGINLPDNLEEAFDRTPGKEAVYYGRSVSAVKASYTVREQNLDRDRILSEISFLSSGGNRTSDIRAARSGKVTADPAADARTGRDSAGIGADGSNQHLEGKGDPAGKAGTGMSSPVWVTPARRYSGLSARGGKPLALFSMPVEVSSRNEGVYRFEIAGCDKAGNLLIPCALQKKIDSSAAVRAQAARTTEHGRGKGQYWSECKVIDVTAPTGILKVYSAGASSGGGRSCCYEFRFDTDANRPVIYEPFRKALCADVVIASEDMSPTRISCRLRSADPDRDKSYQGSNPRISGYEVGGSGGSGGRGGWGSSNSLRINVLGEQAFYLENIIIRDRAGNVRINEPGKKSTMEKSGWIYLDQTSPQVSRIEDGEAPQVRIVADKSFTRHEADGERYIYRPDGSALDLLVSVTDPGGPARSSGLREVTMKVTAGDVDITDKVKAEKIPFVWKSGLSPESGSGGTDAAGFMVYGISDAVIHIPTGDFAQSNDITVRVEAVDNSGNKSSVSRDGGLVRLGIDTVGPRVEVNYRDSAQPRNERFFAGSRTVEISVIDRNVDSGKIHIRTNIDIPDGFAAPHTDRTEDGKGEKGNEDRWVKSLVFERDGDYTLDIDGTDALGNPIRDISWNGPSPHEFTIDRTPPAISILLKNSRVRNGKYYNSPQEAEITILEKNFRQEDVRMELTAGARGHDPQPAKPDRPSFYPTGEKAGETHKALIRYEEDGYYSIRVNYTDPAGNTAEEAICSEFVVDRTPPRLLFDQRGPFVLTPEDGGREENPTLEDGHREENRETEQPSGSLRRNMEDVDSSSSLSREPFLTERAPVDDLIYTTGDFRPFVRVEDTYWDRDQSFFEARAAGRGEKIRAQAENEEENSFFDLCMPEFEIRKEADGVYYVRVCAADLAGNRSREVNFRFSLNRFGSSYEEGDAGREEPDLRNSPTRAYIHRYFNRRTDDPVSIREINPVGIREYEILMVKDGLSRKLKEGEDFKRIIEKETEGDFRYRYEIFSRVFAREGSYSFVISSRDRAGNENSTGQVMSEDPDTGRLSVEAFPIAFSVDKTSPTNRITGIRSSDERFRAESLDFAVCPEDGQSGVAGVELRFQSQPHIGRPDQKGADSDRILYYSFLAPGEEEDETHRDLSAFEGEEGIVIPVHLQEGSSWQYLEIVTTDRAGNISTDYRSEGIYEDGGVRKHLPDHRRRFLVSTNPAIHLFGLIPPALVLAAAAAVIFLVLVMIKKKAGKGHYCSPPE